MIRNIAPPLIIIGMHRSGTSLFSELLVKCGVFLGYSRDEHNEAIFYQLINENIFRREGASWDVPEKLQQCFNDPRKQKLAVDYVTNILDENLLEYYWGPEQYKILQRKGSAFTLPWGWKDPRNTITLPVWLQLFPESRVIHIIRHGIDAAVSLWRRETARGEGRADPHYSERCQELTGCFELWESYVQTGREYARQAQFAKEIRYEDLLADPRPILEDVLIFLGLTKENIHLPSLSIIRPDRRFAHLQDDPVKEFYQWAGKNELLHELYGDLS